MKIYALPSGARLARGEDWFRLEDFGFDELFRQPEPARWLEKRIGSTIEPPDLDRLLPPLESQEVWAAGVTYRRSREARMEESTSESDFYDRVYDAERPELFFKATPSRTVGHGDDVRIRSDSAWNVPEAELTLAINREGRIFGYTIGNDMSSRSIEGENPLYLPQAKVYDRCCALGPCLTVSEARPAPSATVAMTVTREGERLVEGSVALSQLKRDPEELASFLFRDNVFPDGCYLLTGTGIVPESSFTLKPGDEVTITIEGLGELRNRAR